MLNSIKIPQGTAQINQLLDGRYIPSTMIRESVLRHLENAEQATQDNYALYREYYDGLHQTQITERIRAFLNVKDNIEFNANYCPIVVDALAERLKVTGFDAGDQGELMWEWWRDNRMDAQQGVVHTGAVRDGDYFEMVEWDNDEGRPCFTFEPACSNGEGVKVHYSKEKRNKIEYASKRWFDDEGGGRKTRRLNLYFEDHIEKYVGDNSGYEGNWRPYLEEGGDQPEPGETAGIIMPGMLGLCGWYWWTMTGTEGGEPLGVPVVHFKNKDQGYDKGQSELANVIPLQNALNKSLIDLLGAADTAGFPIHYGTGDQFDSMKVSPGRFWGSAKPDAKFGRIEAANLAPMIEVKDSFAMEIARVSRTPISYFQSTAQLPAEGSEMQREVGLLAKGEKCNTDFGNAWEDLMKIARRLHNAFGAGGMDEKQRIEAQWKPLQKRNELELLQSLTLKKQLLGAGGDEIIWGEMGYDADQIAKLMRSKIKASRVFASAAPAGALPNGETAQTNPPAQSGPSEQTPPARGGDNGQMPSGGNGRGTPGQPMMEMSRL